MRIIQKIYEIGKYALGVLAIAALYSCAEPVNTPKTPVKKPEAGQTLDDKIPGLFPNQVLEKEGINYIVLKNGKEIRDKDAENLIGEDEEGNLYYNLFMISEDAVQQILKDENYQPSLGEGLKYIPRKEIPNIPKINKNKTIKEKGIKYIILNSGKKLVMPETNFIGEDEEGNLYFFSDTVSKEKVADRIEMNK